jgi:hypothetical protein
MANPTWGGIEQRQKAQERAEGLRSVFEELSSLSARAAAKELNTRAVPAPSGGKWHVIRVRKRLVQKGYLGGAIHMIAERRSLIRLLRR